MPPQLSAAGNTTPSVNRSHSMRKNVASVRNVGRANNEALLLEEVKGEMQARIDEMADRLQASELATGEAQKQSSALQQRLDTALSEQSMLEESVHEQTERIGQLEEEKKEGLRARRELEGIYEAEKVERMREREEAVRRQEELERTVQRMKERDMSSSSSASHRSHPASPNPDAAAAGNRFAPPPSPSPALQLSDARFSSNFVMQKDKIIESLRLELAEAQIRLVEMENLGGGRMQQLQKEMYDTKMQNARLMEENESFHLLLSEKTLNGDFAHSDLLRPPSRPTSRHQPNNTGTNTTPTTTNLADELGGEDVDDSILTDTTGETPSLDDNTRRLEREINGLKDQNKALSLYINNILSRLLQHEQYEQIFDKTPHLISGPDTALRTATTVAITEKDLPPPPPEKDPVRQSGDGQEEPVGFLQRARSVLGGGGGRRGRPFSTAISSSNQVTLSEQLTSHEEHKPTEHAETAPSIPISRSTSTRGNSGHRRANSEWATAGAASVVTSMYRGPSPSLQRPVSPGLNTPTGMGARTGFFTAPQPLGNRVPSGSTVPTISEDERGKENGTPGNRDSRMSTSYRESLISNPDLPDDAGAGPVDTFPSNPSSHPPSTTSSGDRDSRSGGAIMMGSKPRPLRLVQDAAAQHDDAAAAAAGKRAANNRGSWFGWMNKVGAVPALNGERGLSG